MIRPVTGAALAAALLAWAVCAAPTVIESRSEPGVTLSFQQVPVCLAKKSLGLRASSPVSPSSALAYPSHLGCSPWLTSLTSLAQAKICELTPGVKSFSGYITLPATLDPAIQPYDASFFFWFFESRILPDLAPVTLWLQGGPGLASVNQAVSGHNGPCKVKHESNSTELNLFSWNNFSNMLYLDQPVQTGFSYDAVTTGYEDMFSAEVFPGPISGPGNATYRPGKFGSQDPSKTANTTAIAARAVTHFLDLWGQQ